MRRLSTEQMHVLQAGVIPLRDVCCEGDHGYLRGKGQFKISFDIFIMNVETNRLFYHYVFEPTY